jgi:hypothetical protein
MRLLPSARVSRLGEAATVRSMCARLMRRSLALAAMSGLCAATPAVADVAGPASKPAWRVYTIGDSLAAGEGAPDVNGTYDAEGGITSTTMFEDWDTRFGGSPATPGLNQDSTRCHRSGHTSPSAVATIDLQAEFPDVAVVWRSFACSGASIVRGGALGTSRPFDTSDPNKGGILTPYDGVDNLGKRGISKDSLSPAVYPPQITQVNSALHEFTLPHRRIDALVISAGANDMGFGPLVQNCADIARPPIEGDTECGTDQSVKTFIDTRLQLLSAGVNQGVGLYDRLAASLVGQPIAGTGDPALDVEPANVYLQAVHNVVRTGSGTGLSNFCNRQPDEKFEKFVSNSEAQFLSNEVLDALNNLMATKAALHGWTFVNRYFHEFIGHGSCAPAADRWVNTNHDSLAKQGELDETRGDPFTNVGGGIAHPNAAGYEVEGEAVHDAMLPDFVAQFSAHSMPITHTVATATGFQVTLDDSLLAPLPSGYWHQVRLRRLLADGTHANVSDADGSLQLGYGTSSRSYTRTGRYFVIARACGPLSRNGSIGCGPSTGEIPVSTFVPATPVLLNVIHGVPSNFSSFTKHGITVQWSHADDDAAIDTTSSVVRVRRSDTLAVVRTRRILGRTTATFFSDQDLDPTLTYLIDVKACNDGSRCSAFTKPVTISPAPTRLAFFDLNGLTIQTAAPCSHLAVPFDPTPPPTPTPGASDAFPTFLSTCPMDLPVGRLHLKTRSIKARAGKPAGVDLVWTTPRRWHDLHEVLVRFVNRHRRAIATLRFADEANTLTLAHGSGRSGPHVAIGKAGRLRAAGITALVGKNAVRGSGPKGKTVRLRIRVVVRHGPIGLSIGATDDAGRTQPPVPAGTITLRP